MTDNVQTVAEAFVKARRAGAGLATYPGEAPGDLATAYRIQAQAIRLDGRTIGGWKIGKINPPTDAALGSNRLAGPIFADTIVDAANGDVPAMPIYPDGFAAAEAEFLIRVRPRDGALPTTDDETLAWIDDIRIGIEIASSPYPDINADGPAVTVSDFGNNAGVVLGAALAGWDKTDLCAIPIVTRIDGEAVGQATAATMLDGPLGAVRFILSNLTARGIDLGEGFWASSGAVTGVHPVSVGQRVVAEFAGHGSVACTIIAAEPRAG